MTAVAAATMMTFLAMVPGTKITHAQGNDDVIKLRVCNWEEYIDFLGDWDPKMNAWSLKWCGDLR